MREAKAKASAALKNSIIEDDCASDAAAESPIAKGRKRKSETDPSVNKRPTGAVPRRTSRGAPKRSAGKTTKSKKEAKDREESSNNEDSVSDEDDEGTEPDPSYALLEPKRANCGMADCKFEGIAADFIAHYKKLHKDFKVAQCPKCPEKYRMLAPLVCHVYKRCYNKKEGENAADNDGTAAAAKDKSQEDNGEEVDSDDDSEDDDSDDEDTEEE